jgi:methyl-accepting chemotaxis protein
MMDIACDACGKRYRVDERRIKSDTAKVKCRSCGYVIHVARPGGYEAPAAAPGFEPAATPEWHPAESGRPGDAPAEESAAEDEGAEPATAPQRVRFGLFGKTIIVMLLISLLPFGFFWLITFQETSERIRTDSEALMIQTAKGLGDQVDAWINSNINVLRTAGGLPDLVSMARERQEPVLKAVQAAHPWMYLVFTLGPDGMNIARNDGNPVRDYSDRQYYKDIMAGRAVSWQTVVGRTSNVPALVLAVPIADGNRVIGVMAAAMTVDELSKNIATWKKGRTGHAFLVDEKGFVVAHPQKQFVEARRNMNDAPLVSAFRKKGWMTITTSFPGEQGQATLGHARAGTYGWILGLQQEEREVFEALDVIQNFALALLAITVLLVIATAWFSARALVTPIMKLTDAAERMSLGELNLAIDIRSRDEIGLLAQAIARMQTSLRMAMQRLRQKR